MKIIAKIIMTILIVICALALIVVIGARIYFRSPAKDYYKHSKAAFKIPDIDNGFIPQGLDYNEADDTFLVTGYTKDNVASPIYVLSKDGKLISKATILDEYDEDFPCHSGGISIYNDYVYVAGCQDCTLYIYSYTDIKKGGKVSMLGSFSTKINNDDYLNIDCTTICDGKIILGEFFREEIYPTLPSHKLTTAHGDYNQALAVVYELGDYDETFGINPEPTCVYSIPDQVQGMAYHEGDLYISSSYGAASSHIRAYDITNANKKCISILGYEELPLLEIDTSILKSDFTIPPMSEEIEFVDGHFYTMCESASDKYIFGKLTSHKYCYSTELY